MLFNLDIWPWENIACNLKTTGQILTQFYMVPYHACCYNNTKLIRRWDSERELSSRRHRTRTTKYNRLVHKFRHSSMRRLCVGTYVYQIQRNNAMQRPLRRSRSFEVTDFGTNRKLIYDFLLVINTNIPPILYSKLWLIIRQIFASKREVPHFNAIAWGDLPISP